MSDTELKPCPFCGKTVAKLSNCKDLEDCENFEECGCDEIMHTVVCNWNNGGCGASTGYRKTENEAIEAWNRRENQHE